MSNPVPKYAILEHERRFLVLDPPDLTDAPRRLIEDVYLDCGRLRLRRTTHFDGHPPEFKLCKKYGSDDPLSGPITNLYLTSEEHAALGVLPGRPLRKLRHRVSWNGESYGVDVFDGELRGLVLAEAERASVEAARAVPTPAWAAREVTADPFFAGGHLAGLGADTLAARLAAMRSAQADAPA
jgi:hypothetical protein